MTTAEIKQMPIRERIILMEEIWETLNENDTSLESPEWHRDVLEERRQRLETGEAKLITLDELKKRVP